MEREEIEELLFIAKAMLCIADKGQSQQVNPNSAIELKKHIRYLKNLLNKDMEGLKSRKK